jgi:Cdc6-like AAA superfamily ATPase
VLAKKSKAANARARMSERPLHPNALNPAQRMSKIAAIAEVFRPRTPITHKDLFAGRIEQLHDLIQTCLQPGQHAVVYGERGVGKTSLANVTYQVLGEQINRPACGPINCDDTMDFSSIWHKAFREMHIGKGKTLDESLPRIVTPDDIRHVVQDLARTVFVFDEFDQITEPRTAGLMAATIKNLSDHATDTTIVLVGVADSVDSLIAEHASVERALLQIPMPRMSNEEITEIVDTGLKRLQMSIEPDARQRIVKLSQGLPHITHMLALHAANSAIYGSSLRINTEHFQKAIKHALKNSQQSVKAAYENAVASANKTNLYRQVLLACALAETDSSGYFYSNAVRDPMSLIMGKPYDIPAFSPHLSAFCESERGPVLKKVGTPKNYRFRFLNPLMQPYVIMQGLDSGLIEDATVFS